MSMSGVKLILSMSRWEGAAAKPLELPGAAQGDSAVTETHLGLGSDLRAVSRLGRAGSTAMMVLVQDSPDEILFLRGCSPWEQGLGVGLMSGCC